MIKIPLQVVDGCAVASEPIPKDAVKVVYDATHATVYLPGDELPVETINPADELTAWRESAEVTPRQARLMMARAGLLTTIEQTVSAIGGEALIEWEYSTTFKRAHPLLTAVAAQVGLTDEQLDTMFREAGTL